MRSTTLALVIAFWSASAVTANAQLSGSGAAAEPDGSFNSPSMSSQPGISGARRNGTVHTLESLCPLIESAAVEHGLPIEFFARLIWQESRLRPDALGPATRTGERAQGIAQFMPATAAERLLLDPFEPNQALQNQLSSCASCAPNSAMSGWRQPLITQAPGGSTTGWRESGRCLPRRSLMSASLRVVLQRNGKGRRQPSGSSPFHLTRRASTQ